MTHGHETQKFLPEQGPTTTEISAALDQAQSDITDRLMISESFEDVCESSAINSFGYAYWNALSSYTTSWADKMREHGADSLRIDSAELLAATPSFLYATRQKRSEVFTGPAQRQVTRERISNYNSLLRGFALKYPETSVNKIQAGLASFGQFAFKYEGLDYKVANEINQTVRGAQHELGFGQLLQAAGYEFHDPGTQADMDGVDFIVGNQFSGLLVDVKASRHDIGKKSYGDIAFVGPNHIKIQSQINDEQFHDRFFIPESQTVAMAPRVRNLLDGAIAQAS